MNGVSRIVTAGALVVLLVPGVAAAGHDKVDRVEKTNGDVVTCEILGLIRGQLKIKTDGMGTISIEWPKVVRLTSPAHFEVELSSGLTYYGSLSTPVAGQLVVSAGPPGASFDLLSVVRITPLDQVFWRQLNGSVDVGYTFTQADQRSQWSLNAKVGRTTRRYVTNFNANSLITIEDSGTRQSRNTLSLGVQRGLNNRWFLAFFGQTDQNEELNLDFRGLGGAGFGRTVVQTNRVLFSPFAGLTYTQQRYADQPVENLSELAAGLRLDLFTFGDYKTDLIVQQQTYFDVRDFNRVRVELNTTFKQEVVKDLYWSLNLLESFNAAPPNSNKKNDVTLSMSLGWSF